LVTDVDDSCELEELGFQNLFALMNASACGNCKCKPGHDAHCLQHCSPRAMYAPEWPFGSTAVGSEGAQSISQSFSRELN
jgi:hypothetical protein